MCEYLFTNVCILTLYIHNGIRSQFTCSIKRYQILSLLTMLCSALLWLCVCVVNKLRVSQSQQSIIHTTQLTWMDGWLSCAYAYVFIMFCYVAFSISFSFSYWIVHVCWSHFNVVVQWKHRDKRMGSHINAMQYERDKCICSSNFETATWKSKFDDCFPLHFTTLLTVRNEILSFWPFAGKFR